MKKLILFFATALLISCGNDKKEEKPSMKIGSKTEKKVSPSNSSEDGVVTVMITGNDQMKFNKSEIRVKAGQKVKLTLRHIGKLDKNVMGHDWALLTKDADMDSVGRAATLDGDKEGIPEDIKDKLIVYTKMLGGGESDTIEFDAPPAGTYTYICTFPAHYMTMNGKLIVE
ncbi:azurin [Mesonia sp. MT50]|uniref:Azurin n=1 Tax=Mesonia profundi TaxID=3070998 RepID=A0ABU1A457_9FLAO|nr:azurin [Mesonia profundi]MDQ7918404.1 azurin [Mesonia profundi]